MILKIPISYRVLIGLIALLFVSSAANAGSMSRQRTMGITPGDATSMTICSGYSCARRPRLKFSRKQLSYIDRKFAKIKSPEIERIRITKLIAWHEKLAQRQLNVPKDNAKSTGFDIGPGQMDCIDESTNTLSFIQLLTARGLLKYHKINGYRDRGFVLDFRMPHTTAVLRDKAGKDWAFDSWYKAGGEPPVVIPLKVWLEKNDNSY